MYWHMSRLSRSITTDRAVALHKLIRLATAATMNGGYLNFMGNEFGHPEWIDFPREGNGWSYHYARRQWSLADNKDLLYHDLQSFDHAMLELLKSHQDFAKLKLTQYWAHDEDQVLAFGRGDLLFVFNFHPTQSHTDYRLPVPAGSYHIVLDSDAAAFGGYELVDDQLEHLTQPLPEEQQAELPSDLEELSLYLPSRVALVLRRK